MPVAPVYVDGQKTVTLKGERIAEEFQQIIADYVRATYGGEPPAPHLKPERLSINVKAIAYPHGPPTIQAVRGMNDVLPDEAALWQRFEDTARATFAQYGYRNLRVPIVESRRCSCAASATHRHRREGDVHVRRR